MKENVIKDKAFAFALKIIDIYKELVEVKREYVLSKQLLRSGTSIGANLREADYAISRKEFIAKVQISLKEAAETEYWLDLLHQSGYIEHDQSLKEEIQSIIRILTAIIKTTKQNQ
ncbi:MAG: four helix bundle protein [Candidatus Cloacimonetes bacterium]|nr:four helix bundle protein [Candidatus Cloacimonadota bacterium]